MPDEAAETLAVSVHFGKSPLHLVGWVGYITAPPAPAVAALAVFFSIETSLLRCVVFRRRLGYTSKSRGTLYDRSEKGVEPTLTLCYVIQLNDKGIEHRG